MKRTFSIITAAIMLTLGFASCTMAQFNDGTGADERRQQGYKAAESKLKFWNGYAPFCGIQVWTTDEWGNVWGKNPEIDLDEGTFGLPETGTYMPVFGAFDATGAAVSGDYDLSQIKTFECDVWADKTGIKDMYFSVYHSSENEKHFVPELEPEHISIPLKQQDSGHILFLFGIETTETDITLHIENVAFLDAGGNQITNIMFN